jgi:sugar transport protein
MMACHYRAAYVVAVIQPTAPTSDIHQYIWHGPPMGWGLLLHERHPHRERPLHTRAAAIYRLPDGACPIGPDRRLVAALPVHRDHRAGLPLHLFDIFDINVSFIQTCVALKPGCTPQNALDALKLPVVLNLAGYVIGTLLLSPLADRYGRRNMLLVTMLITGLGSLYTALAPDYTQFIVARVITGMGIGADLAIVNTFIGEVAPRRSRARFTSVIFVNSALGALLGIWLGLILTTPKEPWPGGLPFAQAGPTFESGWRWMYAIGALLALIAVVLRYELPESPRWLVGRGRLAEADAVVSDMERTGARHGPLPDPVPATGQAQETENDGRVPYRECSPARCTARASSCSSSCGSWAT